MQAKWKTRIEGLLNASSLFFKNDIMYEIACEDVNTAGTCDTDQLSFKAYFSRWLAATTKVAPFTHDTIMAWLKPSAEGAAAQCDGGSDGVTCGAHWTANSTWDGTYGVGQQMSALSVIQANLIDEAPELVTNTTGGTSEGNAAAGTKGSSTDSSTVITPATGADKAGAGILTALVLCGLIGGCAFIIAGG
jgi:mannan endo-1,6-alpha-mannosidase